MPKGNGKVVVMMKGGRSWNVCVIVCVSLVVDTDDVFLAKNFL